MERPSKLVLPSSVFASEVEEEVGLLNKAAPQGMKVEVSFQDDFGFYVLDDKPTNYCIRPN